MDNGESVSFISCCSAAEGEDTLIEIDSESSENIKICGEWNTSDVTTLFVYLRGYSLVMILGSDPHPQITYASVSMNESAID